MAAFDLLTFNGTTLALGDLQGWLDQRDPYVVSASLDVRGRPSAAPTVDGYALDGMTRFVRVARRSGSSATAHEVREQVETLFEPSLNGAARTLTFTGSDGSTTLRLGCYVVRREWQPFGVDQWIIELFAPAGGSEADTAETSAANPATVTNAGTRPVLLSIALTTATHKSRRACTVTGAGGGGGVIAYPVMFLLSDAAATATNVFVYVEGVSVPCFVDDAGTITSRVFALVDTASDGTTATNVDIVYGTGLTNPLCGTLDDGGMDWTTTTNTSWEWNDWRASTFPARPGVWRPALTGRHVNPDARHQITTESASSLLIESNTAGEYSGEADSVLLIVGAQAGTTGALTNLSRQTAGLVSQGRAFVRYRVAGSATWVDAWTVTSNTTVTTSIDLDNAVEIVAGIETTSTSAIADVQMTLSGTPELALANNPTVVVGAAENFDYYDGTYQIGSETITFNDVLAPDGTLTIDCEARSITSSVAGPIFGSFQFSDPDQWLQLEAGSNVVSDGLSATDVISWRDGYA